MPSILVKAAEKAASQPPILSLSCRSLAVLGDTHGYPQATRFFLEELSEESDCMVILGDTVDRGPASVENLELIAGAMVEYDNIYLLRGNHESLFMNKWYGFYDEALEKRGKKYLVEANELYINLPVAAVWRELFLAHGGIPCKACRNLPELPFGLVELQEHLSGVKGTPRASEPSDPVMFQLLWNDPDPDLDWFSPSIRGGNSFYYGFRAWRSFLEANGLYAIVRAHETVDGAIVYTGSRGTINMLRHKTPLRLERIRGSVITVFSSFYHGMRAAALRVDNGLVEAVKIPRP